MKRAVVGAAMFIVACAGPPPAPEAPPRVIVEPSANAEIAPVPRRDVLSASIAVAAALDGGDVRGLAAMLDRTEPIDVLVSHMALEAPFDTDVERLRGGLAIATWVRELHRELGTSCSDPDACRYARLSLPAPDEWRCRGDCCELRDADRRAVDHRVLMLTRVCFAPSLRLREIHLVDGD